MSSEPSRAHPHQHGDGPAHRRRPDRVAGELDVLVAPELGAYVEQANTYDQRTGIYQGWRELLVDQLPARRGDAVLDVGCGTGLCLPLLEAKVGASGRIVGIDESPQMLAQARLRVHEHGWGNVALVAAPVQQAPIPGTADAAVFCAVHDVLQTPAALTRVFDHLRPGAAVAAAGGKWPAPWLVPLRMMVAALHAPFVQSFAGFDRPWRLLADFVADLRVYELAFGTGYLALGHARGT